MNKNTVYIVDPIRTPIGKYGGSLASFRPDDMLGSLIASLVERNVTDVSAIDDAIIGCANQAGEDNRNIARMGVLLSGLPYTVPGVTVNRLCASSMEAVIQGSRAIATGEYDVVIVGGVESMSRAPYSFPKNATGAALFGNLTAFDTALGWRYPNPAMEKMFPLEPMGETAENIAERWNISREEQDQFAFTSHQKTIAAQKAGYASEEIVPVKIASKKGDMIIDTDEQPRADTTIEKLATLKPAFRKGGTVTAGNSSSLNDGAVVMILASEKGLKSLKTSPIAKVVSHGVVGVDPRIMGIGPVDAIRMAVRKASLNLDDISLIELNEAFAAQSIACIRELGVANEIVNINGGAISYGHPLGMSGGRIIGSLARSLKRNSLQYGAASLCIGVGQGLAVILENVS
ncbi:MAG: thiolase family protein [Candidatus Kapabacteria bacterium]|nr:thiolase family protein [Candidatus Kapabacteria bacterium]